MMVEDEDDEEVILDKRTLLQPNPTSSLPLSGVNRFNIKVYDEVKLLKVQTALLGATCISIGMFVGILGPTFIFSANKIQTDVAAVIWLIALKGIGFFIGTLLSVYLYSWFNTCCLLGLSCLSISFGVCSLPLITDLATFYLTALILGVGLAISINGIDALYNRLWTRRSLAPVPWLHLLLALGAVLSTLLLIPTSISNDKLNIINNNTRKDQIGNNRLRRQDDKESISDKLAYTVFKNSSNETYYLLSNTSLSMIDINSSMSTTTTTPSHPGKPSLVDTKDLSQVHVSKPEDTPKELDSPSLAQSTNHDESSCTKIYCCYDRNETKNSSTAFVCRSDVPDKSDQLICEQIIQNCQQQRLCVTLTNYLCKIDEVCNVKEKEQQTVVNNCSMTIIDMEYMMNLKSTDLPMITKSNVTIKDTTEAPRPIALSTTTPSTTTITTTTITTTTTTTIHSTTKISTIHVDITLPIITSTTTITTTTIVPHHKPSYAKSDKDDLSENLFYSKVGNFFHSIHSIQVLYLFLSLCFLLLGIFYSVLAIRGSDVSSSAPQQPTTASHFLTSFLSRKSLQQRQNSSPQTSLLFADNSSLKFISILILFYLFLSSIEHSSIYLTYLFGIQLNQSQLSSLLMQFLFFFGLFLGRLFDIFIEYGCYLLNTRIITRTKKQSDRFHSISLKFCILIRLFLLFTISSTLTFSHLFQQTTTASVLPSRQTLYSTFFLIGFIIASLPSLILLWLERDLTLNERLLKIIVLTMTTSEIFFPPFIYYTMRKYILSFIFYLFLSSCLSLVIFIFLLYSSKKWHRKQLYRILPTSMEVEMRDDDINDDEEETANGLVGTESALGNEQQQTRLTQTLEQKTYKLH
ncbi:unnamed protein product [Didymodactylos carnosus]|uniref:Uncharacterized protein n=1 Tax=Didymodactylos carnosus TaxID=1234261 RepID=A0A813XCU6_9BILA|nr:unnamed protein product [Didymodactylos carnosus]CAF1169122.1 unnamed protein product [Didymodactylos carnosus]CAF3655579.1 unnamed protein product [Didymodactylos carnosus]CAF3980582.1 unnamed protein product [Didymodactylos carnosus]